MKKFVGFVSIVSLLAACSKPTPEEQKKKEDELAAALASALGVPSAGAPKTGGGGAKGGGTVELTKFGIKASAPGETEAPQLMDSGDRVLVMASGFTVGVAEAKKTDPKKVKDAQDAAKDFNPKGMKTETLPDGWALTYTNTGSAGTNYWVTVRREIGGKGYLCETTQNTLEQQNLSLAFCKSLAAK